MRIAPALICLLLAGCGYVGEPLPPASNYPAAVTDFAVRQAGDVIEARFTLPVQTLEGLPVKPGAIELRLGPNPGDPFVTDRWLATSRPLPLAWPADQPVLIHRLAAAEYAGQDLVFGVRLANPKGRFASFSNLVALRVVAPLAVPVELRFAELAEGVRLQWTAPAREGVTYRVFKQEPAAKEPVLVATVPRAEFLDENVVYGRTYEYSVQAVLGEVTESAMSATASITPRDTFPPAAPGGVTAIVGSQSVEVAWDRSTDFDFALYRVYRAVDDGEFARVAETGATPAYSDRQAPAGKRYRYVVTAVDERGNESARSQAAEATP